MLRLLELRKPCYNPLLRLLPLIGLCYLILLISQEIRLAGTFCAIQNSKFKILNWSFQFSPFTFHLPYLPKANFRAEEIYHVIPRLVEHKAMGIYLIEAKN